MEDQTHIILKEKIVTTNFDHIVCFHPNVEIFTNVLKEIKEYSLNILFLRNFNELFNRHMLKLPLYIIFEN